MSSLRIKFGKDPKLDTIKPKEVYFGYAVSLLERKTLRKMFWKFSREWFCLFAFIITTIASLQSRYSKQNNVFPVRLFPISVDEWPNGALSAVQAKIVANEISVIFFYAPWCVDSHFAKETFIQVKKVYSPDIYFGAVNCWHFSGECRSVYPKVVRFPIIVAYYSHGLALQFKGDLNFHSLGTFIEKLIKPVERITTSQELFNIKMSNDFVVLGLFEKVDVSYEIYIQAALKALELNRNIVFTVFLGTFPSQQLGSLNLTNKLPSVKIYTRFSSMEYTKSFENAEQITQWISNETKKHQLWYNVSPDKSFALSNNFNSGKVLLLITPKTILEENNFNYLAFKQAFYAYKNCNNSQSINTVIKNMIHIQNNNSKRIVHLEKACKTEFNRLEYMWPYTSSDTFCNLKSRTSINTSFNQVTKSEDDFFCGDSSYIESNSPTSILKKKFIRNCQYYSKSKHLINSWSIQHFQINRSIDQSFCKSNSTLSFHIIDSLENFDFIQKLVPNENRHFNSSLFIIDSENERSFEFVKEHSFQNYLEFINDFHSNSLKRIERTSLIGKLVQSKESLIYFIELTAENFQNIITYENTNRVIMFYSTECAFCNIMSQYLLQIQHVLKDMPDLKFYRIDANNNDLKWEYTMETYPTLLFLPKKKSYEARTFSTSLKINFSNLLGFIISNLDSRDKLISFVLKCQSTKINQSAVNCVSQLKEIVWSEINKELQSPSKIKKNYGIDSFKRLLILKSLHNSLKIHTYNVKLILKDLYEIKW